MEVFFFSTVTKIYHNFHHKLPEAMADSMHVAERSMQQMCILNLQGAQQHLHMQLLQCSLAQLWWDTLQRTVLPFSSDAKQAAAQNPLTSAQIYCV